MKNTIDRGNLQMVGGIHLVPRRPRSLVEARFSLADILRLGYPQKHLPRSVNEWREQNWAEHLRKPALIMKAMTSIFGLLSPEIRAFSQLYLAPIRNGQYEFHGLASLRVVTTAGVNFIVDAFQNSVEVENLKYHGIGTGTNAEASGDTALQTELTTQYNPDNTRATGSTTEGASANIYRTVGTNTVDSSVAITEHGILSQAATGGGTLLDRSVFSAINLGNGDSLQSTYDLTLTAGS
jgi:hypothetical protein